MKTITECMLIALFLLMEVSLYAQDISSSGNLHPHGISSSGLDTKISHQGNTFDISGGRQKGSNLFHSFEKFNLHSGESVVFHDAGIENTIARISGGNYSWINGTITSGAENLYLLNPAGFLFGADAALDLQGSFHISTADYLRMGESDRFYATLQSDVLSVAAPYAFGFLDKSQGKIEFEGRGTISEADWDGSPSGLCVSEGRAISFVGGDIEIKNGEWFPMLEMNDLGYVNPNAEKLLGSLTAPGGQINLASVASIGEVAIKTGKPESPDMKGGNITLSEKSLLDISGQGAGNLFIWCDNFVANDSSLFAKTFGNKEGIGIEIQAKDISFEMGSEINGNTYGGSKGGDVTLNASESVRFSGYDEQQNVSRIIIETYSKEADAGGTGNVDISAKDIFFADGAYIHNGTWGSGDSGTMKLQADDDIYLSGIGYDVYLGYYLQLYFGPNPTTPGSSWGGILSAVQMFSTGGSSGDIEIKADNLYMSESGTIVATTLGAGNGGSVKIQVADSLEIIDSIGPGPWAGGISTLTYSPAMGVVTGDAGYISLEAGELTLKDGRFISSDSDPRRGEACGKSGEIDINVSGDILVSGVNPHGSEVSEIVVSSGVNSGEAGNISIQGGSLTIEDGALITAASYGNANGGNIHIEASEEINIQGVSPLKIYTAEDYSQFIIEDSHSRIEASSLIPDIKSGNSGTVSVKADNIAISKGGLISTSTAGGGKAGDIMLVANSLKLDRDALIASESSFEKGGAAGTISVKADQIELSSGSAITTEAADSESGEATDGKITISTGKRLLLDNSEIKTSVRGGAGKGGDIEINEPEFVVLNHGKIEANAFEGEGGNIYIVSENFVRSSCSKVEASSEKGIDGNIDIKSPDTDVGGSLTVMPATYLDAVQWVTTPCEERAAGNISRFVIRSKDASPISSEDWQQSICPYPATTNYK